MSFTIQNLQAREVLDSRGNPTVEVAAFLTGGAWGSAIVPSGASTGEHEAIEVRDKDPKRYGGKGVLKAVENVNSAIKRLVCKRAFSSIKELDSWMCEADGTAQKGKLGANALLGVSLAFAHAAAKQENIPLYRLLNQWMGKPSLKLPIPLMNILNGGLHANNGLEIQEFMIVPHGFSAFREALRAGCEVFQQLKKTLHDKHLSTAVGDEGGFAPSLKNNEEALELIAQSIEKAGYQVGEQISLALDVAASSFYDKQSQSYRLQKGMNAKDLISFYSALRKKFPLVSIEDGLDENDWTGWREMTEALGSTTQLVGDDLFVTQTKRLQEGISKKAGNAVLIKVNQVGTLSETFETMALAEKNKYRSVVSHRSGETEDTTIAHLAVASGCGQIKCGSVSRSERTAKYNELLRIEDSEKIPFARIF